MNTVIQIQDTVYMYNQFGPDIQCLQWLYGPQNYTQEELWELVEVTLQEPQMLDYPPSPEYD